MDLSRAFHPSVGEASEFSEEVAALCDEQQRDELHIIASPRTINLIKEAAASDDQYYQLKNQISAGWPASPAETPANLQEYATFADELIVSDDLVFKGS